MYHSNDFYIIWWFFYWGAESDLDKVRHLAYGQIKNYGMGDSVGLLSFGADASQDFQPKPYSKNLQNMMDMVSNVAY